MSALEAPIPPLLPSHKHQHHDSSHEQMQQQQQEKQQLPRSQIVGKDLIVRMLAEVFKVSETIDGEICWQQVSTSLVPVSLYSRTTNQWLNYLLATSSSASLAANTTMSPDSRHFLLLLLEQFHQRNKQSDHADHTFTNNLNSYRKPILFQVLAHDFHQGNCRKILNVKILQPGTRIGRASDYFVYWKTSLPSSSSHQSYPPLPPSHHQHHHHHPTLQSSSSFTSNVSNCCRRTLSNTLNSPSSTTRQQQQTTTTIQYQTWGLNFASINDAKLFYDICSLNSIDLNFNSDYLKQLPIAHRNEFQPLSHQTITSQNQLCCHLCKLYNKPPPPDQHHQHHHSTTARHYRHQNEEKEIAEPVISQKVSCLNNNLNRQQSRPETKNSRIRSRSSTRYPSSTNLTAAAKSKTVSLKRLRSLSTPPSPEHRQYPHLNCPIHDTQQSIIGTKCEKNEAHHPRCMSFMKQQQVMLERGSFQVQTPKKPARGEFRDLTSMRFIRYQDSSSQDHSSSKTNIVEAPVNQRIQFSAQELVGTRVPQRRSTDVDLDNSIAIRNARFARAQYANSKNMKDFLSLDAGGVQMTPTQHSQFNKQQVKMKESAEKKVSKTATQKTPNSVTCSTSNPIEDKCNVSTTTDDLPLDPCTKRRIFKLTSEEIISEKSEPRSDLTTTGKHFTNNERKDQQLRATSLEPHTTGLLKRYDANRSEASRRKSLERSTCIDIDLPITSYPPSKPKKRSRTNSTGDSECCLAFKSRPSLKTNHKEIAPSNQHQVFKEHISSFNSAPDVTQLEAQSSSSIIDNHRSCVLNRNSTCSDCNNGECFGVEASISSRETRPKTKIAATSSYAIPLCFEDFKRQNSYNRQAHSCPNSLRRKCGSSRSQNNVRKNDNFAASSQANLFSCICHQCNLLYQRNSKNQRPFSASDGSIGDESTKDSAYRCSFCASQLQSNISQCYNPNSSANCNKMTNWQKYNSSGADIPDESRLYEDTLNTSCAGSCKRLNVSMCRPCSSLGSSKIPLHYGLYESDCEDELLATTNTCHANLMPNSCHRSNNEILYRNSSIHLCPAVKPVQGYDQTMSRSSLKSRQRAKSQPPASVIDETSHLSKSMENVRKLIKEVQKELDVIEKRPFNCNNGTSIIVSKIAPSVNNSSKLFQVEKEDIERRTETYYCLNNEMLNEERKQDEVNFIDNSNRDTRYDLTSSSSATRCATQFKCVGAIRKAGFLSVKKWILKRHQSIELARKQGWKRYWVCLRGTALLFYSVMDKKESSTSSLNTQLDPKKKHTDLLSWIQANCPGHLQMISGSMQIASTNNSNVKSSDGRETFITSMSQCYIEKEPRHLIIIEGAIAQPIPEHPKRDFVFCLSTTFGDAYLFQSSCQLESDNWISAIHNACAASFARDLTREEATKLFETKIRHLELEAEKKLFLRQRLESRLTSMSSISHINLLLPTATSYYLPETSSPDLLEENEEVRSKKNTMRALLYRLNKQLIALDTYSEQVHCEIYQLRCYLSSCESQRFFYQNIQCLDQNVPNNFTQKDLPHPKSLLIHVSKPTKLILIRIGVFTVSSFHAYVHARQGSAEGILKKIQQAANTNYQPLLEFQLSSSQSISERLFAKFNNNELQTDTEKLIHLSNLREVSVRLTKKLFYSLSSHLDEENRELPSYDSDDRYSFKEDSRFVFVNLKLHSNSSSLAIIKQVLKIVNPSSNDLDSLKYYLQFKPTKSNGLGDTEEDFKSNIPQYVAKRRETLAEWDNFEFLELLEKIIFKVKLERKRIDEEAVPFGISVGAQLFANQGETTLNVFCSYIEWGSVADQAGLKDDDELLMINGIPVLDLDMMFIECIIQDETELKLIIRSSRSDIPKNATLLNKSTWHPFDAEEDAEFQGGNNLITEKRNEMGGYLHDLATSGSQIISDEYISSLVCPPPPTKSKTFLNMNHILTRQKSDLGIEEQSQALLGASKPNSKSPSNIIYSSTKDLKKNFRSKSQHHIDYCFNEDEINEIINSVDEQSTRHEQFTSQQMSSEDLASELLKKTERLTCLLGKAWTDPEKEVKERSQVDCKSNSNSFERLKRSVLELIETECAYIKHLETIIEKYMDPLEDSAYLNIQILKNLNQVLTNLFTFQRDFYENLIDSIRKEYGWDKSFKLDNEYEQEQMIIKHVEQSHSLNDLEPLLKSIATIFTGETDNFKIYSTYCAIYSKLQKFLHPKLITGTNFSSISSAPTTLDTFLSSNGFGALTTSVSAGFSQQREFFKPFMTNTNDFANQLKHLNEFLSNLNSNSSSASLSLTKSSTSSEGLTVDLKKSCKSPTFHKTIHQQNFESYLIKPIQRIVKYPMLLNSIANAAQQCSSCTQKELQEAFKQMSLITSHVNDSQRIHDEFSSSFDSIERQFLELQNESVKKRAITSLAHFMPPISLQVDQLLYYGPVDWLNINEFSNKFKKGGNLSQMLFVFNSCVVLICKEQLRNNRKRLPVSSSIGLGLSKASCNQKINYEQPVDIIRYQTLIPVKEVQVRSVPLPNVNDLSKSRYLWELFRCSSVNSNSNLLTKSSKRGSTGKVYLLANSENEIRNAFLRKIRFIIRESVRNMSLPPARSPSSKSTTPKKLSSPLSGTNSHSSCSQPTSLSPECTKDEGSQEVKDEVECKYKNHVEDTFKTSIEVTN